MVERTVAATLGPVRFQGRSFVDIRSLPRASRDRARSVVHQVVAVAPPRELLCEQDGRRRAGATGDGLGRAATFDLSYEEMLGDVSPIEIVEWDGKRVGAVFVLFNIRILRERQEGLRVACRLAPCFADLVREDDREDATHLPNAVACADAFEWIVEQEFALEDGTTLDIVRCETSLHREGNRTLGDIRARLFREEMQRRIGATPNRVSSFESYRDGDRSDWERLQIRDSRKQTEP